MQETCRICLDDKRKHKEKININCISNGKTYSEVLEFLSGIKIDQHDNFPNKICTNCIEDLKFASFFKQKVLDSELFLKSQARIEVKIELMKDEPIEDLNDVTLMAVQVPEGCDEEIVNRETKENTLKVANNSNIALNTRKLPHSKERKNKVPNELDYKCFLCNAVFDKISAKNCHVKSEHKNERICKVCQFKSKTSLSLETHVKFHVVDHNFMCEVCSKVFRYRNRLVSHMLLHHEKATEMVCDLCGLSTKFKNNIKRHMKSVHMKLREFSCDKCTDHKYSTREALNSHLYRSHNVPAPIKCTDCRYGFTFDSELRSHKKHGICSKSTNAFIRRGKTNYDHLQVVDQTGEHICKICNEAFPNKNKFSMHNYLKHKYSNRCEECNVSFTNYTSLIRHQKVKHEGRKPFKCEFCFKAFGQKVSLISHRNTHTGEKTFGCAYCPFKSGDHGTVSKHKKKFHPEMMIFSTKTTISENLLN